MTANRRRPLPRDVRGRHEATFSRFRRGTAWPGFPSYGTVARCSCGWELRHNGPQSEAREYHREHVVLVEDLADEYLLTRAELDARDEGRAER